MEGPNRSEEPQEPKVVGKQRHQLSARCQDHQVLNVSVEGDNLLEIRSVLGLIIILILLSQSSYHIQVRAAVYNSATFREFRPGHESHELVGGCMNDTGENQHGLEGSRS